MNEITFNKPFLTGNETAYICEAVRMMQLSGNGIFTKRCQRFFEQKYGFRKCLLTTSCTDALEMAAMLCSLQPGDEVIVPSYTFVSTALAFVREGAKVVFADSMNNMPNLDASKIEALITPRTRVIVPVHYAGVACDMDAIMAIADKYHLIVVEDAAQAIDAYYKGRPLGTIGQLSTFSFHETKNIISGEGGMLCVNDERLIERAEIIWEKGTNRTKFFRGEIDKYGWVDTGSSFLPSEIIAAFLWAQIECMEQIQNKRKQLWEQYYTTLLPLAEKGYFQLPFIPDYATNNGHLFYLICKNIEERTAFINKLKEHNILALFHYLSLHKSAFYAAKHDGRELPNSNKYADSLVRLPMYYELQPSDIERVCKTIADMYI